MRVTTAGTLALLPVLAGCANRFGFDVRPGPPEKGAATAVVEGIDIAWSRVEEAEAYRVYVGTNGEAVSAGDPATLAGEVAGAPFLAGDLQAGQRYYVAIETVAGGAGADISEVLAAEPLRDPLGDPGEPARGIEVDAGLVLSFPLGASEGLRFASYQDPGGGQDQSCTILWNDAGDESPMDPCDLSSQGHDWKNVGRFQPVLSVEDASGRVGEAFTTVYVR